MDLGFTEEQRAFRQEVRQFLRANMLKELERKLSNGGQLSIRRIKELACRTFSDGERLIDQANFREKVVAAEVQLKALEISQLRVIAEASKQEEGTQNPASSILKLKGSQIEQAVAEVLMDVVGPYALPSFTEEQLARRDEPPIGPDWAAPIAHDYFYSRAASIYSGSSEIQRHIIAKGILGL